MNMYLFNEIPPLKTRHIMIFFPISYKTFIQVF